MVLFRGIGDDLPLQTWLEQRIWPLEAKLTPEDIYWGAKLAFLEMIKSGTTTCLDMYFHMDQVGRAAKEMGLRAFLAEGIIDLGIPGRAAEQFKAAEEANQKIEALRSERIKPVIGPHSIYTVSEESLLRCRDIADKRGYLLHTHLSETQQEVDDSMSQHGLRPAQYLDKIGLLAKDVIVAHGCFLDESEIGILASTGAKVAHCPTSNMKLAAGRTMPYASLKELGVVMGLGTDGAASNNNLDMFEAMKIAALVQKFASRDASALPAREAFQLASLGGANALGIEAGRLEVGDLADILLVDVNRADLTPRHDDISNWVYAAHGNCVDTVVCDGQVLMRGRRVKGEAEILTKAAAIAQALVSRGA